MSSCREDPWRHRTSGLRCSTCMWYVEKSSPAVGRCRRHAPAINGFPVVYAKDWCGDHRLDDTKVSGQS